tara:strand:- start:1560 stop:2363 length:804 start_codon:yes stop_codon:yes gene_type:complete
MTPLIPIAAGVGSFLLAKASGASNRDSLIAGGIGALGAYGLAGGQFGTGKALFTGADAATKGGLLNIGAQGTGLAIGAGVGAGTLYSGLTAPDAPPVDMSGQQFTTNFEGVAPEAYKRATENLQGITQRASYAPDPSQQGAVQPSVYDFTNQEMYRAKEGGLAEIKRFREGGVNYLPSKIDHDEGDVNNYVRATGYVEDGSGNGDKDKDTMLAQLADGEFVSRADAILGAGIMEGANPEDFKEMRRMGAKFFYKQQDQFKRIYDITS